MRPSRRWARASAVPEAEGVPYLVFNVAGEDYALRLGGVREIVGLSGLQAPPAVPSAPRALRGVLDLRGERIAMVDLATSFGGGSHSDAGESCALVVAGPVEEGEPRPGLVVDGVSSVSSLAAEQMAPAPRLGTLIPAGLVAAVARLDQRLVPVLDLEHLLAAEDVRAAVGAARVAPPAGAAK